MSTRPTCEDCGTRPADVVIRDWSRGVDRAWSRNVCGSCLAFRQLDLDDFFGTPVEVQVTHHYTKETTR